MALAKEIVTFAHGNTKFYEQFMDFEAHRIDMESGRKVGVYDNTVSLSEKTNKLNEAFLAEVERMSGFTRTADNENAWIANPSVKWAAMAIIDATVNAILPVYALNTLAPFVDFKPIGAGDILKVKVMPKTLYTVSLGGKGERTTFRQKKFAGNVIVTPHEHLVTVYVDMYAVLAGKENIADAVRAVVIAVEAEMYKDAIAKLNAGLGAVTYPSQFVESGAFDAQTLITLAQRVEAYNGNIKPVIMGTAAALANVIPDSTAGYRGNYGADGGSVNIMRDFYGFNLYELPQAATNVNYGLALSDNVLYVVSPAGDKKLVAGGMSTVMTNSNQFYDNADITQNFTYRKNWGFEFIGAAFAGIYTISNN